MIGRLILLIIFIVIGIAIFRLYQNTPKSQLKSLYWKVGMSILAIMLLLLAVTGRIHWIGAIIAAAIPFLRQMAPMLIRLFPLFQQYKKTQQAQQPPSSGNSSEVETAILRMTLNHDSNTMSGEVLNGPFAKQPLDALALEQLQILLEYCHHQDQDSAKLLIGYLNHRFGNSWQSHSTAPDDGNIDEAEAYSLLGLTPETNKEAIIQAHRRLMQKVHPDRGGNDYLAAKVNQAKDLLLKRHA